MEEPNKFAPCSARIRKNSAARVVLDPLECWNLCFKDSSRQCSSVSKVKTILNRNDSPLNSNLQEDKTLISIQKKLEVLSSVQTSINQTSNPLRQATSPVSPLRNFSAKRPRKGVIYKPLETLKNNIIELKPQNPCTKCKLSWLSKFEKLSCDLCLHNYTGTAFEIELTLPSEGKAGVLGIADKEISFNANTKFKCVIVVPPFNKENIGKTELGIEIDSDWNEFNRISTPSFQVSSDVALEPMPLNDISNKISFAEDLKSWQDLNKEIDAIIHKQSNSINPKTPLKAKQTSDSILFEYTQISKKIINCLYADTALVIEKTFKGLLSFCELRLNSFNKLILQSQEQNILSKNPEQKNALRITNLNKLLQKYQENPYKKRS
jgi:hypothetical protein